jgi:EAL domain-containing protein (putative c-di-GMP-specific phosphodiesterase class I)/GGDEF domain-containing protein
MTAAPPSPRAKALLRSEQNTPQRQREFRRYTTVVTTLAVAVTALAARIAPASFQPRLWVTVALLVAGFFLAEVVVITFDVAGGVGWKVSFAEVPMVLALLCAPIPAVLGTFLAAGIAVLIVTRELGRWWYNAAVLAIEVSVACTVFTVLQRSGAFPPVAAAAGALTALLCSAVLGLIATPLVGRKLTLAAAGQVGARVVLVGLVNATLTALGYVLATQFTVGLVVFVPVVLATGWGYGEYFRALRGHRDLSRLSRTTWELAATAHPGADIDDCELWPRLADRVREQINARRVILWLWAPGDDPAHRVVVGDALPDPNLPALRFYPPAGGLDTVRHHQYATASPAIRAALSDRGADEALVMTLRGPDGPLGVLEVHDRRSPWRGFGRTDRYAAATMALQLSNAVANRTLVNRLRYEAHHEPGTGMLNRTGFHASVRDLLTRPAVLIQLELDIHLPGGIPMHDWTDTVHVVAAARVAASAGAHSIVASLGPGVFTVLAPHLRAREPAEMAEGLQCELAEPYLSDGVALDVAAVAGYVTVPGTAAQPPAVSDLLRHAATALAAARHAGEPARAYTPAMGLAARRRLELSAGFRDAVEHGEISVHYQPKVELATRRVIGVEALVRWVHPEFGPVSPVEFVPALETTNLTPLLSTFVLDTALAAAATWAPRIPMSVAVNMSALDMDNPALPDIVLAALRRHGVSPHLLTLELTESVMVRDHLRTSPILTRLREVGVRIAIDDFGTGYSSLAYLRQLPVDELKIDREFITGVTAADGAALVRTIVALGRNLGLTVVAEGVEDAEARDIVLALGCDVGQGYFYARPLPADVLPEWLATHTTLCSPGRDGTPGRLPVHKH